MDDIVDALVFKLQSKICCHRDAHVEYLDIKTMVDKLVKENKKLQDEKMEFLGLINSVIEEKENLQHDYQVIKEGVAPMKEQLETVKKELEKTKHEHVAAKKELEETKHEHVAARKELEEAKHGHVAAKKELDKTKYEHVAGKKELEETKHEHVATKKELEEAKQQLAQRNEKLEVLRKKLQESEAMHTRLHQQKESAPGPEPEHSRRVTRSTQKREMSLQELLSNDVDGHRPKKHRSNQHASRKDDLEVTRQKLIKEFTEIGAGQYLGIKEMGKLDEKPFRDACAMKLPPRKSGARASEVYTLWQELLSNPNWKPFNTVTVEEVVIDVDDVKLQGLKMAWGEGPFNSVISALVERKEYNTDGTGCVVDFWNYKEGRKATARECVEHILDVLRNLNSSV